jgi:serine/threonine-protein kinase
MISLTLLHPQTQAVLETWHFPYQPVIQIGRAPDNQIVLTDPLVSRYHLELKPLSPSPSSGWILRNRGTNGTFVNGVLVTETVIYPNDVMQLAKGGPLIKFVLSTPVASPIVASVKAPNTGQCCARAGENPPHNLFCAYCGRPVKIERKIRQYQILRVIGQGGMGTTYLAWDEQHYQRQIQGKTQGQNPAASLVVLKEMNADIAQIRKAQELFQREAGTLKKLDHHGIPHFFDYFVEAGKKYLIMEMIHGQDLERYIFAHGPVVISKAIRWMLQTCEVLDYIHSQAPPLIHRDIKPANLLLRHRDHHIVVLDFGAVKEIGTPPGTRIGAEGYSAPEQDRGQPLTQSDLYAIGSTLIFLLTAESPMKYYDNRGDGYRFFVDTIPTITPRLGEVIMKVTSPKPSDRYQTAKELAIALDGCL